MPVSPLTTSAAPATRSHSSPRSVRPARTRSAGSPAAWATASARSRSAGGAGDQHRARPDRPGRRRRRRTGPPASASRRRPRRGARGPVPGAPVRPGGCRRRSSGSAGIPTACSSAHHRARSCGCAAATASHSGPSQPGPASGQRNPIRRRGSSASSARWLCGPVPCRFTATSGAGPVHGTAVGSGVGSSGVDAADRGRPAGPARPSSRARAGARGGPGAARAGPARRRAGRRCAARAGPARWVGADRPPRGTRTRREPVRPGALLRVADESAPGARRPCRRTINAG